VINGMRSATGARDDQWASIAESLKNTVINRGAGLGSGKKES